MDKSPEVPQDVLRRIFAILEIPDLVRAGTVCSSWRAAYTSLCSTGNCRLQQTPCLLYTSESTDAREADTPSVFPLSKLRDFLFYKAFLSSDPSMGGYFVVLIHNPHSQLSFARAGDVPPHSYYEDCLFKEGLLYASTTIGEIHTFNLGAPAVTQKVFLDKMKDIYYERIYIVQGSVGEMLQIWRSNAVPRGEDEDETDSDLELELDRDKYVSNTAEITVYEVEPASKKIDKISSLGQNVLFLGHNLSLCLHAEGYPQLKANHVYFTDDDFLYTTRFKNNRRDIGVFDLENNSSEEITTPQLWSNWPTPVWLIPNPRRMSLATHS
ncbi:F-box domain containing protein, expressed [Panicum miliaceum]|uniref:F-box domain containing protein, expressed n=1 Tax=Panicum miliaceum TaxID=4540 RepID=A0A3L6Q2V4_PANMI|nr:F-box domain containing protein, expressed [Panicum miliaceum]